MDENQEKKPRKTSLGQAVAEIESLLHAIDEAPAEEQDQLIVKDFDALRDFAGVTNAVDRHLFRMKGVNMLFDQAVKEYNAVKEKLDRISRIKKRSEAYLFEVARTASFPLVGTVGEITTEFSPQKSVQWTIPVQDSKSVSNVVSADVTEEQFKSIDQKFLTRTEIFSLNKNLVKEAIKKGEDVPFATLVKKENLCLKHNQSLLP